MIVLSLGIDFLKHFGYSKAVDYTWEHGRSCIVLSFFFAINTVIGKFKRFDCTIRINDIKHDENGQSTKH